MAKVVAPKKQSLKVAEDDLAREMDRLQIKRNELQEVTNKLQLLYDDLEEKQLQNKVVYNIIDSVQHLVIFHCSVIFYNYRLNDCF